MKLHVEVGGCGWVESYGYRGRRPAPEYHASSSGNKVLDSELLLAFEQIAVGIMASFSKDNFLSVI